MEKEIKSERYGFKLVSIYFVHVGSDAHNVPDVTFFLSSLRTICHSRAKPNEQPIDSFCEILKMDPLFQSIVSRSIIKQQVIKSLFKVLLINYSNNLYNLHLNILEEIFSSERERERDRLVEILIDR